MADNRDIRRFVPDPPPDSQDPVLMEWIMRQLQRLAESVQQVSGGQDTGSSALAAHLADQYNPHNTLPPWETDSIYGDLYPDVGGGDSGVGTIDRPVAHVALGTQELGGMEGFIADRQDLDAGGLLLMGLRQVDPQNPPSPPLTANAPIEIAGNIILMMGGTVYLEVPGPISDDRYIVAQPSVTLPDGRHVIPITMGPEVIYQHEETTTSNSDFDVLDVGEVEVVPALTLVNSYSPNVSTFSFQALLDNPGRLSLFDVIIKLDGVEQVRYSRNLESNQSLVVDSFATQQQVNAGQVLSMWVEATGTHPQSQGWVRGSLQTTTMRIKQG